MSYQLELAILKIIIFKSLYSFRVKLILIEETFALPSNQLCSTTSYDSMLKGVFDTFMMTTQGLLCPRQYDTRSVFI